MTNYEKIIKRPSRHQVAEVIRDSYCADNACYRCPLENECEDIAARLEEQSGKAPAMIQVIVEWLNEEVEK